MFRVVDSPRLNARPSTDDLSPASARRKICNFVSKVREVLFRLLTAPSVVEALLRSLESIITNKMKAGCNKQDGN
jgi:hypothetical protein